ncbi:hypothetical protein [Spirochaeta africana]|uniref:FlgN protein n=1 Tax=Spirochaeta africana (strain ATCC 700263 / DSM 8902 / Z-7692) TaxID=889378 RepID=H9UKK7_SPIAZ|nr:hypothetical protein [Spirochaeta africana]AFG38050.1 hypothetical protein Spiaf_2000 [Spirochaeta africana DSM 8902]
MGYKINYEDNIFFLNSQIKTLQRGMNLEIDPEFFRDKIVEDLLFLDQSLRQLFSSLRGSRFLIARPQHLRDLQRTISLFIDLLDHILDDKLAFAQQLRSAATRLKACRLEQHKNRDDIQAMISDSPPEDEQEDTVSQDEFRFLLTPDKED